MTTFTFCNDLYSDLHKDAYGFRPRGGAYLQWQAMSDEQKQVEWDYLCEQVTRREQAQQEEYAANLVTFQQTLATYAAAGVCGGRAIEALHDAHGTHGDDEYLDFCLGVRYGTIKAQRQSLTQS